MAAKKDIKHSERAHALLGASSSGRWLTCTPSARLEENFPESPESVYAAEGTFAHELSELEIRYALDLLTLNEYVYRKNDLMKADFYTEEMVEETDKYIAHVRDSWKAAKAEDKFAEILIEDKIDLSTFIPEGFGSNDIVILSAGTLYVKDLKFGKGVKVSAKDNSQLKLYALGALEKHGFNFEIETIHLEINQPRLNNVSTFELDAVELIAWGVDFVTPRAAEAFEGLGAFVAGDHCRWCKAAVKCKTYAAHNLQAVKDAFTDPELLTDEQLLDVFDKAPAFVKWVNSVADFVKSEALAGRKWAGYKLIEGRSVRSIGDEDKAKEALSKAGLKPGDYLTEKLKGITELTKTLGKKDFDTVLGPLIIKPAGKPALVTVDDPRPELNSAAAVADLFEDESENI